MIRLVAAVAWRCLARDRVSLALTFVLPVVFFTIFAAVFGGMDAGQREPVDTLLLVAAANEFADRYATALADSPHLRVVDRLEPPEATSERAREAIRSRTATVAVLLPEGFADSLGGTGEAGVELWVDGSNPIASELAQGVLQSAALTMGYALMLEGSEVEPVGGGPVSVTVRDAVGAGRRPSVSFFAAGIGVMFLMFSLAGRAGLLIEERESGIVDRMLAAGVGRNRLLLGRWLFLWSLGGLQMAVMFVWAWAVFGLQLWSLQRLSGFAAMTVLSSASAAAFGLAMAAACRTRGQLVAASTVLVLLMSALGGSMFPRFLMPDTLRDAGRFLFNTWALDGYQKVFWYDVGPSALGSEAAVLLVTAVVLLGVTRLLMRSWHHG